MTHAEKAALRKRKNAKSGMIESSSPVSILVDGGLGGLACGQRHVGRV